MNRLDRIRQLQLHHETYGKRNEQRQEEIYLKKQKQREKIEICERLKNTRKERQMMRQMMRHLNTHKKKQGGVGMRP